MTWKIDPDPTKQSRADKLKLKQRELREDDSFPIEVEFKTHRALSWIRASEEVKDVDSKFLFLWIAFNALYVENPIAVDKEAPERERFYVLFRKLIECDRKNLIRDKIWDKFSDYFRNLKDNHYTYKPFWNHVHRNLKSENWRKQFTKDNDAFVKSFQHSETVSVLADVFDRLYVLRNQILHGGSTWNSSVNRSQVKNCTRVLYLLVPIMVEIMLDNPHKDWGTLCYPNLENDD